MTFSEINRSRIELDLIRNLNFLKKNEFFDKSKKIKATSDFQRFEVSDQISKVFPQKSEISTKSNHENSSLFQFSTEIPNLLDVQRQSFYNFLENGFHKAFSKPLDFSTPTYKLEIHFFPEWVQFRKPDYTQKQAFILGKTYGSAVYIPIGIKLNESKTLKMEWLFLGVLPVMTKHGHFIINGIPRVVLHQMIRNPGIYSLPRDSRTQSPTIRIVPEKGGWINLTVDKKNRVWFSNRLLRRKVSILVILQALGFSQNEIFQKLNHSELLTNSYIKSISPSLIKKKC